MNNNSIYYIFDKIENSTFFDIFANRILVNNLRTTISFVNPYSSIILLKYPHTLNKIDHLFVDGALQVYLANKLFKKDIKRYSFDFSSIANFVFETMSNNKLKLAIIGGNENDNRQFTELLVKRYPDICINYCHSGFFDQKKELIDTLKLIDADLLLLGMGTPLQEDVSILAKEHSKRVNIIITCGGFITQTASKGDYYHPLIKKTGLRWLQRAFIEPHFRKRLLIQYPKFIWLSFKSYFSKHN